MLKNEKRKLNYANQYIKSNMIAQLVDQELNNIFIHQQVTKL